ncbi:MAG: glycine cleavage system aminomethyltransferase GcvT [Thermoplasmata archaeon]
MKTTPLHEKHIELGAKMVNFNDWDMPIQYTSIIEEHMAVRKKAGMFDVSHMGDLIVSGNDAAEFINKVQTANIKKLSVGRMKYTHLLNDEGKIIDDLIIGKLIEKEFLWVVNAGTTDIVLNWLNKHVEGDVKIKNASDEYGCIAIQGPLAQNTLQKLTDYDLSQIKFFGFDHVELGEKCIVSRTGYTGEDGFEIISKPETTVDLWDELLDAGKEYGIKPAGLGARDTLRLEKGYLLSGQDFHNNRTPLEASAEWVVHWDHEFIGKNILVEQKKRGDYDRFVGMELLERGIPRTGHQISKNGKKIGTVTSGTMSPVLKKGIALGYVSYKYNEIGMDLTINIRDEEVKGKIVKVPFL